MRAKVLILVAAAAAAVLSVAQATSRPVVQTSNGAVAGIANGTINAFLGIPFAVPPVGDLRWKSPVPAKSWAGTLDATRYGNACYQSNNSAVQRPRVNISEDCLYLNVWTPATRTTGKLLPVIVWIYGGGWDFGSSSFHVYDGSHIVKDVQDVVVISGNYRLNVFGWLGSSSLQQEDPSGSAGNYGLQDQRLLLQWVQQNAAAFGGDKNSVTIFGESAGAGSVSAHLLSQRSVGLFHRAIIQSGAVSDWTAQAMRTSQSKYDFIAGRFGCNTSTDVLACMRNVPTEQMYTIAETVPLPGYIHFLRWGPIVDGVELTDDPRALAAAGKWASPVPVLLGTDHDEGTAFIPQDYNMNQGQYLEVLSQLFDPVFAPKIAAQYPASAFEKQYPNNTLYWALSHVYGDYLMACPTRRTARALVASGLPVYRYLYTHILAAYSTWTFAGCFHSSELPIMFDIPNLTPAEHKFASSIVKYWTSFAIHSDPNYPGSYPWPAYVGATDPYLQLDLQFSNHTMVDGSGCDFWDSHMLSWKVLWP